MLSAADDDDDVSPDDHHEVSSTLNDAGLLPVVPRHNKNPNRAEEIAFRLRCAHIKDKSEFFIKYQEMQYSMAASCPVCHLYKNIILAVFDGRVLSLFEGCKDESEKKLILEKFRHGSKLNRNENRVLSFNILERDVDIQVFIEPGDTIKKEDKDPLFTTLSKWFPTGMRVGRYTNSDRTFETARRWLKECLDNHKCLKPCPGKLLSLPKRLVDVQGSLDNPVRLVETQGHEYPYVCLSHRWGSPEHRRLKSTTRNIQDHMSEISWDNLPATFRDAVTICRRMEVPYIWIDSLCILQEFDGIKPDEVDTTKQDFANENAAMAQTYRNSYFTISADISTNMDSGIFSTVPTDDHGIEVVGNNDVKGTVYFRTPVNHDERIPPELETRGWTFQEYLLPSRVLHFGPFDIEWRCRERHTCECGQMDLEESGKPLWHRRHILAGIAADLLENEGRALEWWEEVVHAYSQRYLTNASDKLPALSGMAQLRRQAGRDTYLAGLWKSSLVHDLCWYYRSNHYIAGYGVVGRRPAEYRAPSWSWVSLDVDPGESKCCFWWTGRDDTHPRTPVEVPIPVCRIFEAFCQPKTADPTGEVRYGFLDMEAVLITAKIGPDSWNENTWKIGEIDTNLSIDWFKADCEVVDDDLSIGGQIYCVPVLEAASRTGLQRSCLVLKKLYANLYQRIGFCVLVGARPLEYLWGPDRLAEGISKFKAQDYSLPDNRARIIII